MDGIKTTRRQEIQEVPWGMWVWQCADGEFLGDEEGNFMHVFVDSRNEAVNEAAKKALASEARAYGFPEGRPVFWPGRRPITDEQLEHQLARAAQGLVPDPLDIAAIKEEERALKNAR